MQEFGIGVIVGMLILVLLFVILPAESLMIYKNGFEAGYKAGQVDAINGIIKYEFVPADGTDVRYWKEIESESK